MNGYQVCFVVVSAQSSKAREEREVGRRIRIASEGAERVRGMCCCVHLYRST